jgi:hypothetical protein
MVFNWRRIVLVLDNPAAGLWLMNDPTLLRLPDTVPGGGRPRRRAVEFVLTTPTALEEALSRRLSLPRGRGGRES